MRVFYKTILVIAFVAVFMAGANYLMEWWFVSDKDKASSFGDFLSGITSVIVVFYIIVQYESYLRDKKTTTLNEFNQRYITDKNVEKVVKWMLANALCDENGRIVGKDPKKNEGDEPSIYEKENFMRFFEELNILIEKGLLKEEDALRLFAYYALVFDEYPSFRENIKDYNDPVLWYNFHQFITRSKITKNFIKSQSLMISHLFNK